MDTRAARVFLRRGESQGTPLYRGAGFPAACRNVRRYHKEETMFPIIPFIIPAIHFAFDWIVTIAQWPSISALI